MHGHVVHMCQSMSKVRQLHLMREGSARMPSSGRLNLLQMHISTHPLPWAHASQRSSHRPLLACRACQVSRSTTDVASPIAWQSFLELLFTIAPAVKNSDRVAQAPCLWARPSLKSNGQDRMRFSSRAGASRLLPNDE